MTYNPNPAYNTTDQANRGNEIDPSTEHNVINEHIIDEANQVVSTYNTIIDLSSYKNSSIQWVVTGAVSMKFFLSNDEDQAIWSDKTTEISGVSSITSSATDTMAFLDTNIRAGSLRIEHITTTTVSSIDVFLSRGN